MPRRPADRRWPLSTSSRTATCPAPRNPKRWQDIEELLGAGIDVITTVTSSTWSRSTTWSRRSPASRSGRRCRTLWSAPRTRSSWSDMTAEALRRRWQRQRLSAGEGRCRPVETTSGRATSMPPRAGVPWTADRVDEGPAAVPRSNTTSLGRGRPGSESSLRSPGLRKRDVDPPSRTGRRRVQRRRPLAVHVARSDGLTGANQGSLATQRLLVESLGGTYHQLLGQDVAEALLAFARAEMPPSWSSATAAAAPWPGCSSQGSGEIAPSVTPGTSTCTSSPTATPVADCPSARQSSLSRRRRLRATSLAVALPPLLTILLVPVRGPRVWSATCCCSCW